VLFDLLPLADRAERVRTWTKRKRLQNLTEERKKEAGSSRGVEFEGIGESRQPSYQR